MNTVVVCFSLLPPAVLFFRCRFPSFFAHQFRCRLALTLTQVAAGHSHAALVTTEGALWMWGMKNYLSPKVRGRRGFPGTRFSVP